MKKTLVLLVVSLCLICGCKSRPPLSDGLTIGMTSTQVKEIYGPPETRNASKNNNGDIIEKWDYIENISLWGKNWGPGVQKVANISLHFKNDKLESFGKSGEQIRW